MHQLQTRSLYSDFPGMPLLSGRVFDPRSYQAFSSDSDAAVRAAVFAQKSSYNLQSLDVDTWVAFTPTFTGLTSVGSPTITGRYISKSGLIFVQVEIIPGTTVATIAGTTYFALPVTASAPGVAGDGSMMNFTTLIGIGLCAVDTANSRCYVPSQGATGNTLTVACWYEG